MLVLNKFKPWHVEVIPGANVVGLVTNKELCQVIWGITIKNFMHKYSFIVSKLFAFFSLLFFLLFFLQEHVINVAPHLKYDQDEACSIF